MNINFNLVDSYVQDMIADCLPVEDVVAVTKFQTAIKCGQVIESLKFVDLHQELDVDSIISMVYMIAEINKEFFQIIFHFNNQDDLLKSVLKYGMYVNSAEQKNVMEHVRNLLK